MTVCFKLSLRPTSAWGMNKIYAGTHWNERKREKRYLLARLDAVPVRHCGRCVHAWYSEDGAAIACSFKDECRFQEVKHDE